jgi:branched-chain amino acid transport system ATP-binding protein
MPKLVIENLKVTYGPIVGTDGVGLTLDAGETVALIGANGAGKSSTLKAILGMATYPQGTIVLDGHDLKGLRPSQVVRRGVGYSPEGRRVFPQLSVLDNLRVGGITRARDELPERIERIYGYFPRLKERADQRAGSLSGGEQQMLAIGRALMSKPRLLLLDEPSLGLAPLIVRQIFAAIRDLNAKEGLTVLLVEQNANQALRLAHRGYVLVTGRITMEGTGAELLARPEIRDAYLGGGH